MTRCVWTDENGAETIDEHDWRPKEARVTLDSRTGRYLRSRFVEQCANCGATREATVRDSLVIDRPLP